MFPQKHPMAGPLTPAPPARYLPLESSLASGMQTSAFLLYRETTTLEQDLSTEIADIVSEIFKEDLADRRQARRYLWEFFD